MKKIIQELNADIDTVSVDSQRIRDMLLDDDRYNITVVPTILILYSSGQHKVMIADEMDAWFSELVSNIQNYYTQQSAPPEQTPLIDDDYDDLTETFSRPDDGTPKALRRGGASGDMRASLSGPGRPRQEPVGSGMDAGMSDAQSAMISEHIRGAEPTIPITTDPNIQPTRKEVKKDAVSAAELAKQMAEQREQYDEKVEEGRPFI